jgi:hypothetical protein
MTTVLVRLLVWLPTVLLVVVVRLLLGTGRLGLRLLGLAGFRGARLAALAATLLGVWWAARQIGLRPAAWLAVIGWAAWATRHHRASIRQHVAVRRLIAALERQASTLAVATQTPQATPRLPRPRSQRPGPPPRWLRSDKGLPVPPQPAADQAPEQAVAALGRYAAAWVGRHTPTRPDGRHPR